MEAASIIEELENGSLKLEPYDLANIVTVAATEQGFVNCDKIRDVVAALNAIKKNASYDYKIYTDQKKKEAAEEKAKVVKEYFKTLKEGDSISWVTASGAIMNGMVGKQGTNAKTAHVILNETTTKKPDRYVKFDKIILPDNFKVEKIA